MYISTWGIFLWGVFAGVAVSAVALVIYGIAIIREDEKKRANRSEHNNDNTR